MTPPNDTDPTDLDRFVDDGGPDVPLYDPVGDASQDSLRPHSPSSSE